MPAPTITWSTKERLFLQDLFLEMYQNDQIRSLEGDLIKAILTKMETEVPQVFSEVENRRIQYLMEQDFEIVTPWPYPYAPLTNGQPTGQSTLINSILVKLKAAAAQDSDGT